MHLDENDFFLDAQIASFAQVLHEQYLQAYLQCEAAIFRKSATWPRESHLINDENMTFTLVDRATFTNTSIWLSKLMIQI